MICFAWWGLPQYGARSIGAFVGTTTEEVVVITTRPVVPIRGMDKLVGCRIHWIENNDSRSILDILGRVPRVLIVSGWCEPAFNRYRASVRRNGGVVFTILDNNYMFTLKEVLKNLRFRFLLRRQYDGFIVPGESGHRLLKFYGVAERYIAKGAYSADASLFRSPTMLSQREKRIVYVGQFCARKNILNFCTAFSLSRAVSEGWTLALYGSGSLKDRLSRHADGIEVHDFVQPEELAGVYQTARVFVLPSYEEHWGVVVHEAALSGCFLLLSQKVGAREDFLGKENGMTFDPRSRREMVEAINRLVSMSDEQFDRAQAESSQKAQGISIDDLGTAVRHLCKQHGVEIA